MKIFLPFLLIIIFTLNINAQSKPHIVELKVEENIAVSKFYVSEIIDNRLIKINIGFAQKGLFNKRVSAVLPDSIQIYLKEKINNILTKEKESEPLTLIIHEFNVSERTSALSEKGIFRFRFELAKRNEGKLYSLWYTASEVESGGMDVTKKHGTRILKGIKESLKAFSESDWENKKGELIVLETNKKFDFSKKIKKGLYASFSQLVANNPFLEDNYRLIAKKNKKYPKFKIQSNDSKKINKRITFISDGTHIYMSALRYSYDSHFVKSLLIGKYLYFEDRVSDPSSAVAFGLIGAAVSNKVRGIVLDTDTGLVYQLNKKNILKILEPYPELKKKYLKSKQTIELKKLLVKTINKMNQ